MFRKAVRSGRVLYQCEVMRICCGVKMKQDAPLLPYGPARVSGGKKLHEISVDEK